MPAGSFIFILMYFTMYSREIILPEGPFLKESKKKKENIQQKKERIRKRYGASEPVDIEVIPARPKEDLFRTEVPQRVGIYARVSTDGVNQVSSYELQRYHYNDMVSKQENWELVDIYADEGISGTSLKHRDNFKRMIRDCKKKKIDLIVTKSVSRFARNLVDCVATVRELRRLNPPVGVYFEEDNIYTLDYDYQTKLSMVATMSEEESHTKSKTMQKSLEWRFMKGILLTPVLYGYDHDEDGNLIVNEEEARVVSLIFFLFLYGYSCSEIAKTLTKMSVKNFNDNTEWSSTTIYGMLRNERYCGDVLAWKTYTYDYLEHKTKKNEGDAPQFYKKDHHEAIVSREDFVAVQMMIDMARHGIIKISPELKVIGKGILKGFVLVNPHWSKFTKDDYISAARTIQDGFKCLEKIRVAVDGNDEDMSDYQVVRGEFLGGRTPRTMTFRGNCVRFSKPAIQTLDSFHIEMLIEPLGAYIAIRPGDPNESHSLCWGRIRYEKLENLNVQAKGFIDTLYDLFDWNRLLTYRVNGSFLEKDEEKLLFFDIKHTEILIPSHYAKVKEVFGQKIPRGSVVAYKKEWGGRYGDTYYGDKFLNPVNRFTEADEWNIQDEGITAIESPIQMRDREHIKEDIDRLKTEISREIKEETDGNRYDNKDELNEGGDDGYESGNDERRTESED